MIASLLGSWGTTASLSWKLASVYTSKLFKDPVDEMAGQSWTQNLGQLRGNESKGLWSSCDIKNTALESKGYGFRSGPLLSSNVTLGKSVSSVTQSCPTLRPHGLQHARLSCPSPTPGACSNSCPLSRWCHPTISSSVAPFSSCPQSFSASGSFPMSQFFASGGQYWSFSFNISPSNEHPGLISFRMEWLDLLSVQD